MSVGRILTGGLGSFSSASYLLTGGLGVFTASTPETTSVITLCFDAVGIGRMGFFESTVGLAGFTQHDTGLMGFQDSQSGCC